MRIRARSRAGGEVNRARIASRNIIECPVPDDAMEDRLFDRRWASLLDRALARLEAESISAGKSALLSRLLPALTGGRSGVPFAAIAAEMGMTEGSIKMAASRLRKRYGEILREEIARTLADPSDVEDEVKALFAALAT